MLYVFLTGFVSGRTPWTAPRALLTKIRTKTFAKKLKNFRKFFRILSERIVSSRFDPSIILNVKYRYQGSVWPDLAPLTKNGKFFVIFKRFIWYFAKCWQYLCNFVHYWANFLCCKRPNMVKQLSHLVTLQGSHQLNSGVVEINFLTFDEIEILSQAKSIPLKQQKPIQPTPCLINIL